jgi:hypothetical protein
VLDALFHRDIALGVHRFDAALARNLRSHLRDLFSRPREHGDPRALARKRERDGATDAATAAGD